MQNIYLETNGGGSSSEGTTYKSHYIIVLDHGLKADGTTDNSTALQDLINEYGYEYSAGTFTNGKALYFPDGIYKFNSTVTIPYNKPINLVLSPNAVLTTDNPLQGIIQIGTESSGITGVDGMPPVIFHGGVIDCSNVEFGLVHWSGRSLCRIEDTVFLNIGRNTDTSIISTGLKLGRSVSPYKSSGDCVVTNCTFNGRSSILNNRAILVDSADNHLNDIRMSGIRYGVTQNAGVTHYNHIHMVVTQQGMGMNAAAFNRTIGVEIVGGDGLFNDVYFDTFGTGVKIERDSNTYQFTNCIWYDYQDVTGITYNHIDIANSGFMYNGKLGLINCTMYHSTGGTGATYNYIICSTLPSASNPTDRMNALYHSNAIVISDCKLNLTNVPVTDIARNLTFDNKALKIRPNSLLMNTDEYYPIALIRANQYDSYKLTFNIGTVVSGEIDFYYRLTTSGDPTSGDTFTLVKKDVIATQTD